MLLKYIHFSTYMRLMGAVLLGIFQLTQSIELVFYYNKSSLDDNLRVAINEGSKILASPYYNPSLDLFIFLFGFTQTPNTTGTTSLISAVLENGQYNVVLGDWSEEASAITVTESLDKLIKPLSYGLTGIPGMMKVAFLLAEALKSMVKDGLAIDKTFIMGYSLGAHMAGYVGKSLKLNNLIPGRICGLDPAGPIFESKLGPAMPALSTGDADFVYIISGDPGGYGTNHSKVDMIFYPNFKAFTDPDPSENVQPGCPKGVFTKFTKDGTCSHGRPLALIIESFKKNCTFLGCKVDDFWDWQHGLMDCSDTACMGDYDINKTKRGTYYLITNPTSPFGKGEAGLHPQSESESETQAPVVASKGNQQKKQAKNPILDLECFLHSTTPLRK